MCSTAQMRSRTIAGGARDVAEQTAVRSRRVRHIAVFGIPKCYMDHGRSSVPPSSDCNYSPRNRDNTVRTEASGSSTAQRDNQQPRKHNAHAP